MLSGTVLWDTSDKTILFELKEKAKWSRDPEEKKAAIRELSAQGPNALPQLEEIFTITAYEDIRNACAEAIREIEAAGGKVQEGLTEHSEVANPAAAQSQKKEKKESDSIGETEIRLADLPP